MVRGYIPSTDVMNNFLTAFDVDDGRTPCPMRTQTVTAPQALFTMNSDLVEKESAKLAAAGAERKCRAICMWPSPRLISGRWGASHPAPSWIMRSPTSRKIRPA